MDGYKVTVTETSKEISVRERIRMKDTSNMIKLDDCVDLKTRYRVAPTMWAKLHVENPKSDNNEYNVFVLKGIADGEEEEKFFYTSSESFETSLKDIMEEMDNYAPEEEYQIEIYKLPSKNNPGNGFITCTIL